MPSKKTKPKSNKKNSRKSLKKSVNKKKETVKTQKQAREKQKSKEKTLKDFLKEVVGIVAGKQSEEIVDLLDIKNYVNEFLIAKKLDITINQTRNILYKIADHGLVSNIRKKDKKKGWYTYFWRIEALKSLEFLQANIIKKISQIEHQIKSRKSNRFYICKRCNIELKEGNALLYDFTCQECGAVFELKDDTRLLRELEKNFNSFNQELEAVKAEIGIEKARLDKKREKEIKKRKRARTAKRRRTIARKKANKKTEAKKSKPVKKKSKPSKTQKNKKSSRKKTKKNKIKKPLKKSKSRKKGSVKKKTKSKKSRKKRK